MLDSLVMHPPDDPHRGRDLFRRRRCGRAESRHQVLGRGQLLERDPRAEPPRRPGVEQERRRSRCGNPTPERLDGKRQVGNQPRASGETIPEQRGHPASATHLLEAQRRKPGEAHPDRDAPARSTVTAGQPLLPARRSVEAGLP